MPEIRFKITERLDRIISNLANTLGVDKSDYVKNLILNDIRKTGEKKSKEN